MFKRKFILTLTIMMLLVFVSMLTISCANNKPTSYNISKGQTSNGSFVVKVDNAETSSAEKGAVVEVVATPANNYEVQSVYYVLADKTDKNTVQLANGKYTFTMPESNITVYVTFTQKEEQPEPVPTYTIKKGQTQNGTFDLIVNGNAVADGFAVEEHTQVIVKPSANKNYAVAEAYYLDSKNEKTVIVRENDVYTFEMPASNVTVYVSFVDRTPTPDSAFKFSLSESKDYYILDKFIGSQTDVVIPSIYGDGENGQKPIKEIGTAAFSASSITSVFIPNTIEIINESSFFYCSNLKKIVFEQNSKLKKIYENAIAMTAITSIVIPSSVELIAKQAMMENASLATVIFEKGSKLKTIEGHAFSVTAITSITIPASVTSIDSFAYCASLTTVLFEEGSQLQTIGDNCFVACSSLETLVIPQSVKDIGQRAFDNYANLPTIYYCGDSFEWSFVNKPTNPDLEVFFYQATQPTDGNNYWHYDENGLPTKW